MVCDCTLLECSCEGYSNGVGTADMIHHFSIVIVGSGY